MDAKNDPLSVLIVDDMPQVRRDLSLILPLVGEEAGIPIRVIGEAEDGQQAIVLARRLKPDVILMDLAMPGLNGFEATRMIKAEKPSTRVIALTIHCDQETRLKAQQAGVDRFIEKGVSVGEILRAIAYNISSLPQA